MFLKIDLSTPQRECTYFLTALQSNKSPVLSQWLFVSLHSGAFIERFCHDRNGLSAIILMMPVVLEGVHPFMDQMHSMKETFSLTTTEERQRNVLMVSCC